MSKRKKQEKKQPQKQPVRKPGMTLEQKFNFLKIACMVLTAIITIAVLAFFF